MPRPRAMAAFASAPGEGRVCHFIMVATRLISSMPRGLLRLRKRNSIGSMPAAAASSSVKLSTAKQLAGLPGERNGAGRSGASFSQCTMTWMRSEEHTSELQSRVDLVCRLLLEKKKDVQV